jgi:glycine cleavage system H protein
MSRKFINHYEVREDRYYTETDEWVVIQGNIAIIGITDYAQKKLRDIVGVDLPKEGKEVKKGESVGVIESVKAASDVYSPLTGKIIEVNKRLVDEPELLNKSPYDDGWIFKLEIHRPEEKSKLLSPEGYIKKIGGESG